MANSSHLRIYPGLHSAVLPGRIAGGVRVGLSRRGRHVPLDRGHRAQALQQLLELRHGLEHGVWL